MPISEYTPPCDGMQHLFFPDHEFYSFQEMRDMNLDPFPTPVPVHMCEGCPIRRECLERGWNEDFGWWGGFSFEQRYLAQRAGKGPDALLK